jgi:hypothetical protein
VKLEPGTVVASYRIEGLLGLGGMAVVYRAEHVDVGRQVALKVLAGDLAADPEFVARFRREGRLQASLEHPHVVTVYEAGESEHGLYLAMRLVAGSTLAVLMSERAVGAERALALLGQVAEALDAAHAAGFVHRDVKPQNVLVGDADDAYLGDFGLTRIGGVSGVTATGRLVGTVSYLAPEVVLGEEAVPASDRYAFAATLFECLTGTAVYPRRTEAAILYAHTSEPVPQISRRRPELPRALDDVFTRALAKDPRERPASARALVDAVRESLGADALRALGPPPPPGADALDATTAAPVGAIEPPGRARARTARTRRTLAPWVVGAVLVGAGAAAGVAALADDGGPQARAPAPLPGATVLGSSLAAPGRTRDCLGNAPTASSPGCTLVQAGLPGRALVVPKDGVIRRWGVRSARGELALAVLRPLGAKAHQVARSENEFVTDAAPHIFDTDLPVSQGDLVGLVAVPGGSAVGVRPGVGGATTKRWIPVLTAERGPDRGPGTGLDDELLLRVEYVPGGEPRRPRQVTGAAAARLPAGRVRTRRRLHYTNGRAVEIALVVLGDRFAFDEFIDGRRTARIDVPQFRPDHGRIIELEVYAEDRPAQLGIYVEFNNDESARILDHFYAVFPREFQFVD